MREIKFRVWDKVKKEFLKYPCYFNHLDFNEFTCFDRYFKCDEDECVVQQFTGLKDKNGVEIYEGDIIQFPSTNHEYLIENSYLEWFNRETDEMLNTDNKQLWTTRVEIVEFDKYSLRPFLCSFCPGGLLTEKYVEVIGNIFENPGLLNEKQ
jgi:uncharacterized phage protein (TIGR01671 family)